MDCYQFLDFRLNPDAETLSYCGVEKKVPVKVLRFLVMLLEKPGAAIDKQDIFDALWPDQVVSEASLSRLVSDTRQILAECSQGPEFIHTIRNKGFRFNPAISVRLISADQADKLGIHLFSKQLFSKPLLVSTCMLAVFAATVMVSSVFTRYDQERVQSNRGTATVVVLPINVATNDIQDSWAEFGLMTILTKRLQQYPQVSVIDVNSVLQGLGLIDQVAFGDREAFSKICPALGCETLVVTELKLNDGVPALSYALYGEKLRSASFEFIHPHTLQAADMMFEHLLTQLVPVETERLELKAFYSDDPRANLDFAMGVSSMYHTDYRGAQKYLEMALERSPDFFWAKAYLADVYYRLGEYDITEGFLEKISHDNQSLQAQLFLQNIASNIEYARGNLQRSQEVTTAMLPLAETLKDFEATGNALMNIGTTWTALGDSVQAAEYLTRAVDVYAQHGLQLREAQARFNLGNALQIGNGRDKDALQHYQQAASTFRRLNAQAYLAYSLSAEAGIQRAVGKFDEARQLLNEARQIYTSQKDEEGLLLVDIDLAMIALTENKLEDAEKLAEFVYVQAENKFSYVRSHASAVLALTYLNANKTEKVPALIAEQDKFEWFDPRPAYAMLQASYLHNIGDYKAAVDAALSVQRKLSNQWSEEHQAYLDAFKFSLAHQTNGIENYFQLAYQHD